MKDELIYFIKRDTSEHRYGEHLLINNLKRLEKYCEYFEKLVNKFIKIKKKYNYTNMNKWTEYPEYFPHLTLFKSMTEMTLILCVDYEGGISPNDKELSPLIEDPMIYEQPDFETEQDEYLYVDINYEIHNKMFFTILSQAWLESNGHECGLVVKTLENNSTQSFYLNDLKWGGSSKFENFNDRTKPVKNEYNDSIKLDEIYNLVGMN